MSYGVSPVAGLLGDMRQFSAEIAALWLREETTRPAFREVIDNLNWSEM